MVSLSLPEYFPRSASIFPCLTINIPRPIHPFYHKFSKSKIAVDAGGPTSTPILRPKAPNTGRIRRDALLPLSRYSGPGRPVVFTPYSGHSWGSRRATFKRQHACACGLGRPVVFTPYSGHSWGSRRATFKRQHACACGPGRPSCGLF
jgi:hypothetical protein